MPKTLKIAPANSLIIISDVSGGIGPEFIPGRLVLSTSTMISVGCLANVDGETQVTLGSAVELAPGVPLVFEGELETPSGEIAVSTVEGEKILEANVGSVRTGIRIWANRPVEPDEIVIGWLNRA